MDDQAEALADEIEGHLRTGRPLADPDWIADHEATLGRNLAPQKPGRKPKAGDGK